MDAIIEVEGLRKAYGRTVAVEDVSFTVNRGEIFGILGPNGAGKTTTVEALAGLRRPDAGRVRVLGFDPERQGPELRQRLGLQLQQSALPERLRVWEALELFGAFYRRPLDWRPLLEQWGLGDKRNAAFADLSGGQRQRLFIALALIGDPELVILDELTAGLDPQARRTSWEMVAAIRDAGTTVVLDRDAFVVVYCSNTACQNSVVASTRLVELGYTDVHEYVEGKQDWIEAGLPVEQTSAA